MRGGSQHDVDLAAAGVGILAARHAEHASFELAAVELRFDLVAGTAGAHGRIVHRLRLGLRIAKLDNEIQLDPVQAQTVVEAILCLRRDVLDTFQYYLGEPVNHVIYRLLTADVTI